ncbi:type VI secretion protein IcmF/TssM N-terminal domain-containing protein [Aureimonas sp. AU20]|uniref:type VI secretion protein IcmF/TssM N-terminal domain-containing protein n=1 Tax=Aureimonas sp. AU20 TaxID=1349819 RepID=UPI00072038E9|nr:type VI secretion protein IcmF/TssM N-terminal domain-containing protein [Aureimonas sp. AU20]ALN74630.1 hypothetical protein M673_18080 [Aureimonas sp. AU20]
MTPRHLAAWSLGLVLALGAGLVVWRLAPVASDDARFVLSAVPVVVWAILLLLFGARPVRPNAPATVPISQEGAREWRSALAARRLAGPHQRYRLPLFVLLGPPGMGKSQLLERSGLDLDAPVEADGARWWLGSEAIFVEIASEPTAVERLAAFLQRFRPACPLNGVVLAVSPADLTLADALERREIGEGLAASLGALEARSRSRPPVYVALTKIDLAPGFLEGFEALEPGERHQSWGFSFPLSLRDGAKTAEVVDAFHAGVRSLVEATRARLLDALARVNDPLRGGRLIGFGAQVAAMDPIVDTVLRPILPSDVRRRKGAFLRGIYLTSSQQDALTIDALLPELAARYAMPRSGTLPDIDMGDAEHGFFVAGMLRDAVIREAGLVGMARPPWYRRPVFGLLVLAVCLCLSLLGAAALRLGFDRAEAQIERLETQVSHLDTAALSSREASLDALSRVAEATDRIGRLEAEDGLGGVFRPSSATDLRQAIEAAHDTALRNSLSPHLTARLAADLTDLDAERDAIATRLAAAAPEASDHAEALARWLEETVTRLPEAGARASLLHEAPRALTLMPARPEPVYLDAARRILAWEDSQP